MIPRRFFWLFDIVAMGTAFGLTEALMPTLRRSFLQSGLLAQPIFRLPTPMSGGVHGGIWELAIVAPLTIIFLVAAGNYRPLLEQSRTRVLLGGMLAGVGALGGLALLLLALGESTAGRLFLFTFAVVNAALLSGYRFALRTYLGRRRQAGYYAKNVVLAGPKAGIEWMARHLSTVAVALDYRIAGYLCIEPGQAAPTVDAPHLGSIRSLGDLLIHQPIHEVIVVMPAAGGDWLPKVVQDCDYFRVGLRVVPEPLIGELHDLQVLYHAEPLHLPAVVLEPPEINSEALFFKRLFDVVVSAFLLVVLAPLLVVIAVAIKLTTPHLPVFYPVRVVGYKGTAFTAYKFTTMVADADARKEELQSRNEMTGPVFKIKDDPRITGPLGRFLRKYSLNELPQLWSVLKGDMSLVGPRPALPRELARYEFWHKRKLSIRPGITCLWQVRGRNQISNFDDWVRMDLEYIDHWSLWLDFKILMRTALVVVKGTGS